MNLLLDTHLLLWASEDSGRLPARARSLIEAEDTLLFFSTASIWEVAIKASGKRSDFQVHPRMLREELLLNGYNELTIQSAHAIAVTSLPPLHRDPFDRILIAQASVEEITLLTADAMLARYPGPILPV